MSLLTSSVASVYLLLIILFFYSGTVSPSALSTDQLHATPLPPISTPQPTPMIVDDENTTCSALEKLAVDSDCITDTVEPCDRIYCIDQQIPAKECPVVITLMLCMTPAAVRIEITEEKNVVLNEVVSESQEITVEHHFGLVVNVTLDHFDDAIGLQIDGVIFDTESIIEYTVIPLENPKNCDGDKVKEDSKQHPLYYLFLSSQQ